MKTIGKAFTIYCLDWKNYIGAAARKREALRLTRRAVRHAGHKIERRELEEFRRA